MTDSETLSIKLTRDEMRKLDRAWKKHETSMNRSQYVRTAINAYAAETICKVNQKDTRTEA